MVIVLWLSGTGPNITPKLFEMLVALESPSSDVLNGPQKIRRPSSYPHSGEYTASRSRPDTGLTIREFS